MNPVYTESAFAKEIATEAGRHQADADRLRGMELFVLDNSLRETTVGAIRAHTMENKRAIYQEIKKCGFKHFLLESFNHQTRLGDQFIDELNAQGEDLSQAFCFSDLWETIVDKVPSSKEEHIPIGLLKCKEKKIRNVLLEFDMNSHLIDYELFNMEKLCGFFLDKVTWIRNNLEKGGKIMINMRDFSATMTEHPERVLEFVRYVSSMEPAKRIFGLCYEDLGGTLPHQLAAWTHAVKREMERHGWTDGQLLFHQHEMWGLCHASNLSCLAAGATGMWAGVCSEGASVGHADTCTAILNLIRLGNERVARQYNCTYLRDAAIKVTRIVTTLPPFPRMPVYGVRALDLVFPFLPPPEFSLARFFGVDETPRISNMADAPLIKSRLEKDFGKDPQFTEEMGARMKDQMLVDAAANLKEEYNSKAGLSMLFDRAGGQMTPAMAAAVDESTKTGPHIAMLIQQVKDDWDQYDSDQDDRISFHHFFEGFMGPYFSHAPLKEISSGLQCIDMDKDQRVSWWEFRHFLLWAGRQHPGVATARELLDVAMVDGLRRAMDHVTRNGLTSATSATSVTS